MTKEEFRKKAAEVLQKAGTAWDMDIRWWVTYQMFLEDSMIGCDEKGNFRIDEFYFDLKLTDVTDISYSEDEKGKCIIFFFGPKTHIDYYFENDVFKIGCNGYYTYADDDEKANGFLKKHL